MKASSPGTWYTVSPKGYVFLGVWNWGWAISLTVFHTFVSVLTPIYLFDNIMPSYAQHPATPPTRHLHYECHFPGALPGHRPHAALSRGAAARLCGSAAADRARLRAAPPGDAATTLTLTGKPAPGLWRLRLLGFVALLLYFVCIYVVPSLLSKALGSAGSVSPLPALVSNVALVALAWWGVARFLGWTRRPGWSARRQLAFISGVLVFGMIISTLSMRVELVANIPFLLLLIILAWRARNAERRTEPPTQPAM